MNKYIFIGSTGRKHKPIVRVGISIQFCRFVLFEWMWFTSFTTNTLNTCKTFT